MNKRARAAPIESPGTTPKIVGRGLAPSSGLRGGIVVAAGLLLELGAQSCEQVEGPSSKGVSSSIKTAQMHTLERIDHERGRLFDGHR
jgi:hypothetical protein